MDMQPEINSQEEDIEWDFSGLEKRKKKQERKSKKPIDEIEVAPIIKTEI